LNQSEHFFECPSCGEEISFLLEARNEKQSYVEDCEVCCNPIDVAYEFHDEDLLTFSVRLAT
jgi:predicted RNA-binding Zn-ribbon protein involved in translation (DUF1610 family)